MPSLNCPEPFPSATAINPAVTSKWLDGRLGRGDVASVDSISSVVLPPPTPLFTDSNVFDRRERERLSCSLTSTQAFWTRRLWEVCDFPENRQAWMNGDGGMENRELRLHNCDEYVNAIASIGISETSQVPRMITVGPNPFPEHQGEALSWSVGLYMTAHESRDDYPRARTVAKALKVFRPATFEREKLEALKSTFGIFPTNAKAILRIYEEA